jgi:sec-independent protein translocase protein TatC
VSSEDNGLGNGARGNTGEMSFLDHLEELRRRILLALAALVVATIGAYLFSGLLLSVLVRAAGQLQAISPLETLIVRLKLSLAAGFVVALPVIIVQAWRFVAPGLLSSEKKIAFGLVISATICFAIGGLFSFLVVGPGALRVLESFAVEDIVNRWSVSNYTSFIVRLMMAFGIVFELPVAIFFLTKLGIVTPEVLRRKRRYAIVLIFILAAALTPPDAFTQLMLAVPLLILYEVGILVSAAARPRARGS